MQASGLKGKERKKKKALKMHFNTSKTQILPSESMKCNIACVHDQIIYREKQLAFGGILESMLSLHALLIYYGLVLL